MSQNKLSESERNFLDRMRSQEKNLQTLDQKNVPRNF